MRDSPRALGEQAGEQGVGPRGRRRCHRRMSVPVAEDRLYHLWTARAALSVHRPRIIDGRAISTLGSFFSTRCAEHGCARRSHRSSGPARQIGVMQDSAPSTASELGAVLGRGGKETDPHGVSSILWTHLVREPRRKTIRAQKKESDGGHLERSEALARRKVSFLQRQGDTDLHASLYSKAVTDACVTELQKEVRGDCVSGGDG
jgi:hypothetical protein